MYFLSTNLWDRPYKYSRNCNSVCEQATAEIWTVNCKSSRNCQLVVWYQNMRPAGIKTWAELCIKCSVNSVRGHHHLVLTWLYCIPLWCNIISKCVREFPSLPFYLLTSLLQRSFSDKVIITLRCYNWFKPSFAQDRLCRYASNCCVTFSWMVVQSRPNTMMKAQMVRERSFFSLSHTILYY